MAKAQAVFKSPFELMVGNELLGPLIYITKNTFTVLICSLRAKAISAEPERSETTSE